MYVIIVGAGQLGYSLTKFLIGEGHEVLLVEKSPSRYAQLSEELGESILLGDGSELSTLMDMGTNRADVLVAVTGKDQDNLIICQMAKILYLIPKTISKVNDPKNEELFQNLGVDATVSSTKIIASLIEEKIDAGMSIPLLHFKGGNVEIFKTELSSDSPLVDQKISELELPDDCNITAALRGDEVIIPRGHTVLKEGDTLIILIGKQGKESFKKMFL